MNIWLLALLAFVGMIWLPSRGLESAVERAVRPRTRGTSVSAQRTFTAAHDVSGDERSSLEDDIGACRDAVALQRAAVNPSPLLNSVPRDVRVQRHCTSTTMRRPLGVARFASSLRRSGYLTQPGCGRLRRGSPPRCDNGRWAASRGFVKNHARCGTAHFAPGYSLNATNLAVRRPGGRGCMRSSRNAAGVECCCRVLGSERRCG